MEDNFRFCNKCGFDNYQPITPIAPPVLNRTNIQPPIAQKKKFPFFNFHKSEENTLNKELEKVENPQLTEEENRKKRIEFLNHEILDAVHKKSEIENTNTFLQQKTNELNQQIYSLQTQINNLQNQLIITNDEVLYQSFGLYEPQFDFKNSEEYKGRLDQERENQKAMIKSQAAWEGFRGWALNGSASQGKKMQNNLQKLLLRAFNNECDDIVNHVTYSNIEQSKKKVQTSFQIINNLSSILQFSISETYERSKEVEVQIAYEYKMKKEEEKERAKQLREDQREAAKLAEEIEAEREKIKKEQTHYETALTDLTNRLDSTTGEEHDAIVQRITEINGTLVDINKNLEDIDYREANQRAGYVYVISNIGSFGPDVYKIGMTRRLHPEERIDELSGASVPFKFDIHALIFSDDAPKLEAALHKAFEKEKLNMVNLRREFFKANIDDIKKVIYENYTKTVDFVETPEAEQYRISQKLRETLYGKDKQ